MELALSPDILGRTFDGIGRPIDGLGPVNAEIKRDVNGLPLNPVTREYPRNYIRTGISAIDGLTTLIRGQKLPIFSGNGMPHDKLAAQIVKQASLGDNSDEKFARLMEEADKYVGFPYVWGGSTPETSFDCSGFVSYVLTNSGLYNTGRLGAQGLYNISTPVSNPQPGDLVFFTGTYDTPGVSHVGIYVGEDGDGSPVMLHCGDPIQYSRLDTSYWQSHFYAYGRLHYN